jgi:hypothetical protein
VALLDAIRFDHESRTVRGRLIATLRGKVGMPQLTSATLVWPDSNRVSATLQRIPAEHFTASSEVNPNRERTPVADIRTGIEILPTRARSLLLFPFDTYVVPLGFQICAATKDVTPRDCLTPNVGVVQNQINSDAGFEVAIGKDRPGDVILYRPLFFRVSSVALLVSATLFFAVLLWAPTAEREKHFLDLFGKLLGFLGVLGALRSFLVPRTITVFPLLIDYVCLGLFLGIFAMTSIRVLGFRKQLKEDKWAD